MKWLNHFTPDVYNTIDPYLFITLALSQPLRPGRARKLFLGPWAAWRTSLTRGKIVGGQWHAGGTVGSPARDKFLPHGNIDFEERVPDASMFIFGWADGGNSGIFMGNQSKCSVHKVLSKILIVPLTSFNNFLYQISMISLYEDMKIVRFTMMLPWFCAW